MKQYKNALEEFKELAPFLSDAEKVKEQHPSIPPGYFESLSTRMMHQVHTLESLRPKKIVAPKNKISFAWVLELFQPQIAFAVFIFAFITTWFMIDQNATSVSLASMSIDKQEAQEYLASNAEELDEATLQMLLEHQSVQALEKNQIHQYLEENLTIDEIEEI